MSDATTAAMKNMWWDGYDDGNNDRKPRKVDEFQKTYDDGYSAGQQDYFASRK